jgi:hypothetical protein
MGLEKVSLSGTGYIANIAVLTKEDDLPQSPVSGGLFSCAHKILQEEGSGII